jgi:hypothetical protein
MGILVNLKRLFGRPVSGVLPPSGTPEAASAPRSQVGAGGTAFVPSFQPFKPERKNTDWVEKRQQEEWEMFGSTVTRDTYPHMYPHGQVWERFRSQAEVEFATAFDRLGLPWEYEPLKFAMGPKHISYTPDFRVAGLSIPGSERPLYIEVKWFGEDMNLTKYVRFTKWYNCDLLVLAHYDRDLWKRAQRWKVRPRPDVLKPSTHMYYLILRCTHCDCYIDFPRDELPAEDYQPPNQEPQGYESSFRREPCVCKGKPVERIVVEDWFLIQAGAISTQRASDIVHLSLTLQAYARF